MNYRSTSDLLSYTQGSSPYTSMANQPFYTYSKHMFFGAQASREVLLKCFTLLSKNQGFHLLMLGYQGNPSSLKTQLHLHDQSWKLYYHCLFNTHQSLQEHSLIS